MNPDQLESVFANALAKTSPQTRASYLDEACADDPELRKRVEALLKAHDDAGKFLDQPVVATFPASDEIPGRFIDPEEVQRQTISVGSRIGPYKLLQLLGEGGMGAVYMAEQEEPVKRRVAIKIIRAGLDTARVVARFEQERQALAMMDHPSIAKVLDAGATEAGRPYVVMELVKGIPITKYCDQEHLTPKERLDLFIPVCQAVQHAHQKGIIHRDIKPSNVLIALYDGKPVPKVIDFGVAKATGQKLTERTMFTEVGQIVGTLEYMAPEQAELNNLDIDTRADIYSLGVLLYELLTGSPPFSSKQLRTAAFDEMLRIIREVEPQKPSTKLSSSEELPSIAANRKLEPAKLAKLVRGDLDWIVMKCLEKERARRYETANGLAMEVQRYLADEPVLAGPPSAGYRLRKLARKHRKGLAAAAAFAMLLIAATAVSMALTGWALRAERAARQEEENTKKALAAETLARKKTRQTLAQISEQVVEESFGRKVQLGERDRKFLREILKEYEELAAEQGESAEARELRAEGLFRTAGLRAKLGELTEAESSYSTAVTILNQLVADFPAVAEYSQELASCQYSLGLLLSPLGKRDQAEAALRDSLRIEERLAAEFPTEPKYRRGSASSRNALGNLQADKGRRNEAEADYRTALSILDKLAAEFPSEPGYRMELAGTHHNIGLLLTEMGRREQAEPAYRAALAVREKLVADFPDEPQYREELALNHVNLGNLLAELTKLDQAELADRAALDLLRKLAADFPTLPQYRRELAVAHYNLGNVLADLGNSDLAEEAYRDSLTIREKLAADFPAVPHHRQELAKSQDNLGVLLAGLGKRDKAGSAYRAALAIREKLVAEYPKQLEHAVELAGSYGNLADLFRDTGRGQDALEWYPKAIQMLGEVLATNNQQAQARQWLRNAHWGRARTLDMLERHGEASRDWDRAIELDDGPNRPTLRIMRALSAGDHAKAVSEANELLQGKDVGAAVLYDVACFYSLASAAVRPADSNSNTEPEKLKEQYAMRAVELLRQAVAKGYNHVEHMKKDDDLKALREREEFKKLVAEMENKAKP